MIICIWLMCYFFVNKCLIHKKSVFYYVKSLFFEFVEMPKMCDFMIKFISCIIKKI